MKLTPEQIHTFDEQGYVFFPNCFSEDEVAALRSEADAILRTNRQEVWRERPARRAPPLPRTLTMRPSG
jgi:ectoine hydroxylase